MSLPSGYTQLEYIESTGTQWIDTGVYPDGGNIRYEAELLMTDATTEQYFGAEGGYYFGVKSGNYIVNSSVAAVSSGFDQIVYETTVSGGTYTCKLTVNGTSGSITRTGAQNNEIKVFDCGYTTEPYYPCKCKCSYFRIYKNGSLVRDFIPCKNASGTVGLWDDVNSVFYGNAGSGVFFAGSPVNIVLPSGYTQLTYIEATGTQWIDTGIPAKSTLDITIDFQLSAVTSATQFPFYGGDKWTVNYFGIYFAGSSGALNLCYNTGLKQASNFSTPTARHKYQQSKNNLCVDDTLVATTSSGDFTGTNNIALFAGLENGKVTCHSSGKLYSCQIYDNGTLVRDYIPALRISDNVTGLYDLANDTFYANAGSGTFLYPGYLGPAGDHNIRLNGVAYEITGSMVLLGGVARAFEKGTVLTGGVAREIVIEERTGTINAIMGYGDPPGSLHVNGEELFRGTYEITLPAEITVTVVSYGTVGAVVYLNGTLVHTGAEGATSTYTFTTDAENINVEFYQTLAAGYIYNARITTS